MVSCFKPVRVIDKAWLVHLRTQPCLVEKHLLHECSGSVCAHHSLQSPFKGMGCKASDDHAFSVCDGFHKEIHGHGNEDTILRCYGFGKDILIYCEERYKGWKKLNT